MRLWPKAQMKIKNYRRIKELSDLGWKEEREPHPFLEATPKDVVLFLDDYHVVISFRRSYSVFLAQRPNNVRTR